MAITMLDFVPAMGFLCEMLPMQRTLSDEALAMAWETMPNGAKLHLTRESLAFAVKQRLVDPAPPKEQALHIALLRYVFPVERTVRRERGEEVIGDRVLLENGPRADLPQRMAAPDRFHDPAPVRHEQAPPERPRLPGGGRPWHPSELSPEALHAHVERVAAAMQRIRGRGADGRAWKPEQLAQGKWWFERALQGFWPLECDDGGIAAAWILGNPKRADELLQLALAGEAAAATVVVVPVPVGGILGGFGGSQEAAPW
jgi:hypothetical protein